MNPCADARAHVAVGDSCSPEAGPFAGSTLLGPHPPDSEPKLALSAPAHLPVDIRAVHLGGGHFQRAQNYEVPPFIVARVGNWTALLMLDGSPYVRWAPICLMGSHMFDWGPICLMGPGM